MSKINASIAQEKIKPKKVEVKSKVFSEAKPTKIPTQPTTPTGECEVRWNSSEKTSISVASTSGIDCDKNRQLISSVGDFKPICSFFRSAVNQLLVLVSTNSVLLLQTVMYSPFSSVKSALLQLVLTILNSSGVDNVCSLPSLLYFGIYFVVVVCFQHIFVKSANKHFRNFHLPHRSLKLLHYHFWFQPK